MFIGRLDPTSEDAQQLDLTSGGDLDYLSLDSETQAIVGQCTCKIKALSKRTSVDTVEIGENIFTVKRRLRHGQFCQWLETEFDWSDFTARQFMNVAKCFKSENFSDLEIEISALYRLASPSTPKAARSESLARARQGEKITHSKAQMIIERHKHPPIIPEILPPEQPNISSQEKASQPSMLINLYPDTASSVSPEKQEDIETIELSSSGPTIKLPSAPEIPEAEHPEREFHKLERMDRPEVSPATFPPVEVLSIEVDEDVLQRNPLKVLEISTEGLSLCFNSRAGDVVSWFKEQSATLAHKSVG